MSLSISTNITLRLRRRMESLGRIRIYCWGVSWRLAAGHVKWSTSTAEYVFWDIANCWTLNKLNLSLYYIYLSSLNAKIGLSFTLFKGFSKADICWCFCCLSLSIQTSLSLSLYLKCNLVSLWRQAPLQPLIQCVLFATFCLTISKICTINSRFLS